MNILKIKNLFYLFTTLITVGILVSSCEKENVLNETEITRDVVDLKVEDPELQSLLDLETNELSSRAVSIPNCHADDFKALKALYDSTNGPNWTGVHRSWDVVANNSGPTANCDLGTIQGIFLYKDDNPLGGTPGRVQTVKLDNMNLTGYLPWKLYYLRELQNLNLYNNNISSSITRYIGYLPKLTSLDLRYNDFTGSIHTDLYRLRPYWFKLSNNQLSGSIPAGIGNFKFARLIDLEDNDFSGCYPTDMQEICNVRWKYIDSGNNFNMPFSSFCSSGVCNGQ